MIKIYQKDEFYQTAQNIPLKLNMQNARGTTPSQHGWQGCQMVSFQTKNPNLGKFCRALENIFYNPHKEAADCHRLKNTCCGFFFCFS
jgi:hypothetical protein